MIVELKTPSTAALREYNENAERPYFIADSCLLDGGAVELEIGGVTVAGIFHDYDAYELALGVLDMENPERPESVSMEFWTPEKLQEELSEEELEYSIWASLTALHGLRSRQEAAGEPNKAVEGENTPESFCGAELPTQRFTAVPYDFMTREPRFLEPVGLLTAEEIAHEFDLEGQVA